MGFTDVNLISRLQISHLTLVETVAAAVEYAELGHVRNTIGSLIRKVSNMAVQTADRLIVDYHLALGGISADCHVFSIRDGDRGAQIISLNADQSSLTVLIKSACPVTALCKSAVIIYARAVTILPVAALVITLTVTVLAVTALVITLTVAVLAIASLIIALAVTVLT